MNLNFAVALTALGNDAVFRIANSARPPSDYLFATLLPERQSTSYHIESGTMTVRTTMAGLVGMDSPYPPGGQVELSQFLEESAKIAIHTALPEKTLRILQDMMMRLALGGGNSNDALQREALNFFQKVILQAQLDRVEWMRGQALVTGAINWTMNQKVLSVSYGVPSGNFITTRTTASGFAYGASNSKFWADVRTAKALLRYNVRAVIAHSATIDEIMNNAANSLDVLSQTNNIFTFQKRVNRNSTDLASPDARDTIQIIAYDKEAEIMDLTTQGETKLVSFMPKGKLLFVGNNTQSGYRPGDGSTDNPEDGVALGYTHLAPTVEGGGRPGRWGELYVPQNEPWSLHGRGAENSLPVIEAPAKIVVATTELA